MYNKVLKSLKVLLRLVDPFKGMTGKNGFATDVNGNFDNILLPLNAKHLHWN